MSLGTLVAPWYLKERSEEQYLHRQTPSVEVGGDVFLGQILHQVFGEISEETAGLGR